MKTLIFLTFTNKGRIGVQKVLYDPRYDRKDHHGAAHKYVIGSENSRKSSLMLQPRIISHKSEESISSRGNVIDSVPPPSSKGISPSRYKPHPYKNIYSMKANKLAKIGGLPPASKHSGNQTIIILCRNK